MIDRLLVRNTLYRALETDYVVLLGQRGTGVRTTINAFLNWSPLSFNMKFMSVALPRTIYNIDEFKELFLLRLVEATSNIAQEDNLANRISRAIQDNAARSIDFRLRRVLDILGKGFSTHHVVIAIHAFTDIPKEPLKNLLMILREYHDKMNFKGEAGEKLRFLVSGDLHLWELCYHKTNDLSPFNIARRIFLGGLSLEEIMMIDTNMDLTRAVGLRELTGGVPSLVEHAISMEKTVEDLLPFWGYLQGNWNALPVSSKDLLRSLVTDSEKFPTCLRDYDCPEIPVIDSPWMEAFWGGFLRTRYHELAWRSPAHPASVMEYANAQGSISKSVLVKVD